MASASMSQQDQGQMAKALAVVLQHAAVRSNPKLVCTLLQVCKAWRKAIPQTTAGAVVASVQLEPTPDGLATLANLAAWIPRYPSLLQSIDISRTDTAVLSRSGLPASVVALMENSESFTRASEDMLRMSLQQVQLLSAQAAPQGPAAAQHAGQPLLRLQSFSSNVVNVPSVLSLLPAITLTSLKLEFPPKVIGSRRHNARMPQTAAAEFRGMLQQFSNLQELELASFGSPFPNVVSESVSCLGQLTRLVLSTIRHTAQLHLPAHLQQLTLSITKGSPPPGAVAAGLTAGQAVVQLAYLTSLQSLDLQVDTADVAVGAVLPSQLTALTARCDRAITVFNIGALQQLQELAIIQSTDSRGDLQALTSLAQLQQLALTYTSGTAAAEACPVWSQFSQLVSLKLDVQATPLIHDQLMTFTEDVLTLTELDVRVVLQQGQGDPVNLFASLKPMTNLQALTAAFSGTSPLYEQEALMLTALKQLTYLDLHGIGSPVVDDSVAIALALHLTKLEWLSLGVKVSSMVMPAIGMLRNLKHLSVPELTTEESAYNGLQFLTGLTALTHLGGFEIACSDALRDFWDIVRGKDEVFDPYGYF